METAADPGMDLAPGVVDARAGEVVAATRGCLREQQPRRPRLQAEVGAVLAVGEVPAEGREVLAGGVVGRGLLERRERARYIDVARAQRGSGGVNEQSVV